MSWNNNWQCFVLCYFWYNVCHAVKFFSVNDKIQLSVEGRHLPPIDMGALWNESCSVFGLGKSFGSVGLPEAISVLRVLLKPPASWTPTLKFSGKIFSLEKAK